MVPSDPRPHRRALLAGALGSAVAGALPGTLGGCRDAAGRHRPAPPDPVEPVLAAAVYLADRYRAAIAALPDLAPRLTPLREAHLAHVAALAREVGTGDPSAPASGRPPVAPSPSASQGSATGSEAPAAPVPLPTEPAAALADLRELERVGQRQAAAVCLAGPGHRAALLGSIAAARACHAEVLS